MQRVEAFSDGVIAIIITIMVLELRAPAEASLAALRKLLPVLGAYALSFVLVAIMWSNHHILLRLSSRPRPRVVWANHILLFWMSLVPFATAFLGGHPRHPLAVASYGAVLTMCSCGFVWLRWEVSREHRHDPHKGPLHRGQHRKNLLAVLLYASSVPLASSSVAASYCIFLLIPAMYLVPQGDAGLERG